MRKLLRVTFITIIVSMAALNVSAAKSEAQKVREIIDKVNNKWQSDNSPKSSSFWDNAAYHTGNMEAYMLTGNEKWRKYSEEWANHNQWKGAKSNDKSRWRYSYGESDEDVLFGDFQVCLQTYADLYNLDPQDYKIARAREVMEYQIDRKSTRLNSSH